MINLDITLWIQIAEALLMVVILHYILIKPVMSIIKEREEQFKALEKEINDLFSSAEETLKKYEMELEKARSEGMRKREALKEEARKFEKELLAKVMKEVEEKKLNWEKQFKAELEDLRSKLVAQKEMFAKLIVEKVLGRSV